MFLRNACIAATSGIDTTPFVEQLLNMAEQEQTSFAKLREDMMNQAKRAADIDLEDDWEEEKELLINKHAREMNQLRQELKDEREKSAEAEKQHMREV